MRFFNREKRLPESEVNARAAIIARELLEKELPTQVDKGIERFVTGNLTQIPVGYPSDLKKSPYPAYGLDNPYAYYVPQAPKRRPGSFVSMETLKLMAQTYDVVRSCINHRKSEVDAIPIRFVMRDDSAGTDSQKRIGQASAFFSKKGGLGGFGTRRTAFECKILEDVDVVGATAIYTRRTKGGSIYEAIPLPASTIRPKVDVYGWPEEGAQYEQWIMGLRVQEFNKDELVYDGLYPTTDSPYFSSPIEWLINVITSALYAHQWNQDWLTTGNTPSQIISVPETWTPEQVRSFQQYWDLMLSQGFDRVKTKFVPGGQFKEVSNSRKDQEFQAFEEWLMRRTCSIFEVQPASIGYPGHEYKVNQDRSMNATTQFGIGKLLEFRIDLYNDFLEANGFGDIECRNVTDQEEDAQSRTSRLVEAAGGAYKKINEARQEDGLDPVPDGDVILVVAQTTTLDAVLNPPEPVAAAVDPNADPAVPPKAKSDIERWEKKALNRLRTVKSAKCTFDSPSIPKEDSEMIVKALERAETPERVKAIFRMYSRFDIVDFVEDER